MLTRVKIRQISIDPQAQPPSEYSAGCKVDKPAPTNECRRALKENSCSKLPSNDLFEHAPFGWSMLSEDGSSAVHLVPSSTLILLERNTNINEVK